MARNATPISKSAQAAGNSRGGTGVSRRAAAAKKGSDTVVEKTSEQIAEEERIAAEAAAKAAADKAEADRIAAEKAEADKQAEINRINAARQLVIVPGDAIGTDMDSITSVDQAAAAFNYVANNLEAGVANSFRYMYAIVAKAHAIWFSENGSDKGFAKDFCARVNKSAIYISQMLIIERNCEVMLTAETSKNFDTALKAAQEAAWDKRVQEAFANNKPAPQKRGAKPDGRHQAVKATEKSFETISSKIFEFVEEEDQNILKDGRWKSLVERLKAIKSQVDEIAAEVKEVYKEAYPDNGTAIKEAAE